jgi:GNAT superfamily N-acetyltransferase
MFAAACMTLGDALGDTPETVIAAHLLRRGQCRAYVAGEPPHFRCAIVAPTTMLQGEPMAFGDDAEVVWELLQRVQGWFCINVSRRCAEALGPLMERTLGRTIRRLDDVYYALHGDAAAAPDATVRLLGPGDLPLLASSRAEVQGAGFGSAGALLSEGIAAGAIVDGRLVAIAHTSAFTDRHADIGVSTLAPWRGRGLATAAASLVAARVRAGGHTPVWSTGEDNLASRRVAEKLGFREVGRRVYLIPEGYVHHGDTAWPPAPA